MPSYGFRLAEPPSDAAARSLWLEHGAGFVLLSDIRDFAIRALPEGLSKRELEVATNAANDALYGLMMLADGVTGGIRNDRHRLGVSVRVVLEDLVSGESEEMELSDSNGVCGWYHQWIEGDFGATPIATKAQS